MTLDEFDALPEELDHRALYSNLLDFFTDFFNKSLNCAYATKISGYNIKSIKDAEHYTSPITRLRKAKIVHFISCDMENFTDFDLGIDIYGNFWIALYMHNQYMYKQVCNVDEIINIRIALF